MPLKNVMMVMVLILVGLMTACAAKPCSDLAKQVCAMASGTAACERASRLTTNDECRGFLKDVKRYVELTNLVVTTPGVQPPPPPAPDVVEAPDAMQTPDAPTVPTEIAVPDMAKPAKPVAPAAVPAKPAEPVAVPVKPAKPAP